MSLTYHSLALVNGRTSRMPTYGRVKNRFRALLKPPPLRPPPLSMTSNAQPVQ